jgi:RimJ/RimL family protein N-acetyltransferase
MLLNANEQCLDVHEAMSRNIFATIRNRVHQLSRRLHRDHLPSSTMATRSTLHRQSDPRADTSEMGVTIRMGDLVELRTHVPGNRSAFQRWYADAEIANLLRHDLRPLSERQSKGYFDTIILPLSARGLCYAIHERSTGRLVGTTALTDIRGSQPKTAMFRIVIGEKDAWGMGFGTEATRLVVMEAFERHRIDEVHLEVFSHNPRAIGAYQRVGFRLTGEHTELVGRERYELHVKEMAIDRRDLAEALTSAEAVPEEPATPV